jgi:hypothetical protein
MAASVVNRETSLVYSETHYSPTLRRISSEPALALAFLVKAEQCIATSSSDGPPNRNTSSDGHGKSHLITSITAGQYLNHMINAHTESSGLSEMIPIESCRPIRGTQGRVQTHSDSDRHNSFLERDTSNSDGSGQSLENNRPLSMIDHGNLSLTLVDRPSPLGLLHVDKREQIPPLEPVLTHLTAKELTKAGESKSSIPEHGIQKPPKGSAPDRLIQKATYLTAIEKDEVGEAVDYRIEATY